MHTANHTLLGVTEPSRHRRAGLRARAALASIAIVLGMGAAAHAQTQPAPESTTPAAGQANGATRVQEIVVTGSLITRQDFKSESPISTIGADVIRAAGQPSLDKVIGEMPQFAGAQGASEVGDAQGSLGFAGGQSYSDLRGLGPNRSLVLMDGRRLMPSAPDGSIDLNTIPMLLIQNVEVITGGASATYGSDAIAGVVNFKLYDKFKGLEFDAQGGETTHGDGFVSQIGGIVGDSFADGRGNGPFSFQYSHPETVDGASRPFFQNIR